MKSQAVIDALKTTHTDLKIVPFLKLARSLVVKVRTELEAADRDSIAVAQRKLAAKSSITIRTANFVPMMQKIIDNKHRKTINSSDKELEVSRHFIGRIMHGELRYTS